MRQFKFTLQTVHKVRELKNEREKLTLSELQNEAAEAEQRVAHIEAMRTAAVENYLERLRSGRQLNPVEMELSAKHFASLNSLQKEAQRTADEKRQECARQLEKVQAATVDVKVTDKLRDEQQRRHRTEVDRQEQINVDELVSTKFARIIQGSK